MKLFVTHLLLFWLAVAAPLLHGTEGESLSPTLVAEIEGFVKQQMAVGRIPGMMVVVVKGDQTVYQDGFGFADIETQEPVTSGTLFELGSCSKAFTGLAIRQLAAKGSLDLEAPVSRYLPWLSLRYGGSTAEVTVSQLLHHRSGIPWESIAEIPATTGEAALEMTIRHVLSGRELAHKPGERFAYATINYDLLGLVMAQVSGLSYEANIKGYILAPLGLDNTLLLREEAASRGLATGYKLCFKRAAPYEAPEYRGNTPAGYIISNGEDLARWLKIQMGTIVVDGFERQIFEDSHAPDPTPPLSRYASGWYNYAQYGLIFHGGGNPNFSAYLGFGTEKVGVALLANSGSRMTIATGQGILTLLRGRKPNPNHADMNLFFDSRAQTAVLALAPFFMLALSLLLRLIIHIFRGKRRFAYRGIWGAIGFVSITLLFAALCYLVTMIPSLLGFNVPLSFGFVWMPFTFTYAILGIFAVLSLYYLLFMGLLFFRRKN
jgi:putative ATP-binding cassette transporter